MATSNTTTATTGDGAVPATGLELRSRLDADGTITIAVVEADVPAPGAEEVTVRIEAAPVNPSDMGMMFAMGDVSAAETVEVDGRPGARLPVSERATQAQSVRHGRDLPFGNEGAGVVVAAGDSPAAQELVGRTVGFLSGNAYAQYRTVPVAACLPVPDGTPARAAAAAFVNPLTALGMIETMRREGHTTLVHTVGASNLGQMLIRLCAAEGIELVNIVRRPEHVEQLRALGANHVCNSGDDDFDEQLTAAMSATGATIAFDAIGGGTMASRLLTAMERAASAAGDGGFSRYGSDVYKQVYIYGGLDRSPTVLDRTFGMTWGVGGWLLTPFLMSIGADDRARLNQRVVDELTTTFRSDYGMELDLHQAVDPARIAEYGRQSTGNKALITPHGG
ncbi:MAG: zinc-binding dehydrogenase [Actinomycetota bacterium]|nr:zinc-binding dehydrogenase [Actinomycetota bacterium]